MKPLEMKSLRFLLIFACFRRCRETKKIPRIKSIFYQSIVNKWLNAYAMHKNETKIFKVI